MGYMGNAKCFPPRVMKEEEVDLATEKRRREELATPSNASKKVCGPVEKEDPDTTPPLELLDSPEASGSATHETAQERGESGYA